MVPGHPGDHPLVDGAVDAAAEGFSPAPQVAAGAQRAGGVGRQVLEDGEGVDRAGVAGEGDELEERLIQAGGGRARLQGGTNLPSQRPIPAERRRDRDPSEA
jgi:hypothetical protein